MLIFICFINVYDNPFLPANEASKVLLKKTTVSSLEASL